MHACVLRDFGCVGLCATPWTVAHQAPLFVRFSKQEDWSTLPCPPPGDLPDPGIEPKSPTLQADSLPAEPPGKPYELSCYLAIPLLGLFPREMITCVHMKGC